MPQSKVVVRGNVPYRFQLEFACQKIKPKNTSNSLYQENSTTAVKSNSLNEG